MSSLLQELNELLEKHEGASFVTCEENCFCHDVRGMLCKWEQDRQDEINEASVGLGRE